MKLNDSCLWQHLVDTVDSYPTLTQEITVDVCIIGGGYTGLSAGINLAEKQVSSCILEANQIGHGGSGKNVGYINAGVWMKPDDVEATLGEVVGSKLNRLLADSPTLVFDMIERYGIDAQHTQTGNLQLAHNAKTEADIRDRHQQWTRRGDDVVLLSASESQAAVGTDKVRLALQCNRSGTLNPYAYAQGLARAAANLGVSIYENSAVIDLRQVHNNGKKQWQVSTEQGCIFADKVILATNAYTEGDWIDIKQTMFMVNYYQIASQPLDSEAANAILPNKQGAADTRTVLSSMRRDKDNRLLLGTVGSHRGKPAGFMPAWANRVASYYFPQLGKVDWQYQWSGQFGFTDDHLMRVFEPAEGIIAATAFNGRGITTGTLFGKAFADYLVSDNADDLPLSLTTVEENKQRFTGAKALYYETGVTLYHAGQCLRVII